MSGQSADSPLQERRFDDRPHTLEEIRLERGSAHALIGLWDTSDAFTPPADKRHTPHVLLNRHQQPRRQRDVNAIGKAPAIGIRVVRVQQRSMARQELQIDD